MERLLALTDKVSSLEKLMDIWKKQYEDKVEFLEHKLSEAEKQVETINITKLRLQEALTDNQHLKCMIRGNERIVQTIQNDIRYASEGMDNVLKRLTYFEVLEDNDYQ